MKEATPEQMKVALARVVVAKQRAAEHLAAQTPAVQALAAKMTAEAPGRAQRAVMGPGTAKGRQRMFVPELV